jgi:myo-inositol 2-dehydrogenase / D-chiro-inositol 1-dehydrogenase
VEAGIVERAGDRLGIIMRIASQRCWERAMRFGLIGFGAWGKHHADAITRLPGLTLAAIGCGSAESVRAAQSSHPAARVTGDWREVLSMPDIDAIDVVTPNHLHAEVAIAAMRAGKDVLVEKPMAISDAECRDLLAAERETDRVVSVGHELRQSAQWGRIKTLIDEEAIGAPLFLNFSLFRNFYRPGAAGWRYDPARVGSWMLEEAIHYFDLTLWYFARHGDPVSVRTYGSARPGRGDGMHDNVTVVLRYADGAYATLNHCVAGFEHHVVLEIAGTDGAIRTHWSGTMDRDDRAGYDLRVQPRGFAFERGVRECEHLAIERSGEVFELTEQIRLTADAFTERRALVSAHEARKRVLLCIAAERSLAESREIELSLT